MAFIFASCISFHMVFQTAYSIHKHLLKRFTFLLAIIINFRAQGPLRDLAISKKGPWVLVVVSAILICRNANSTWIRKLISARPFFSENFKKM